MGPVGAAKDGNMQGLVSPDSDGKISLGDEALFKRTTSPQSSSKQTVSTHQVSRLVTGRDQSGMTPVTTPSSSFLDQNIITD